MRPFASVSRQRSGLPSKSATPSKSILRQPSALGRRNSEYAGLDSSDPVEATQSPSKRRKVLFDEENNSIHELGIRSMDEVRREVKKALEEHMAGDSEAYDALKGVFSSDRQRYIPPVAGEEDDTPKPEELKHYLMSLTNCVPLLKHRTCNGLLKTVLNMSWLGRDMEFFHAYVEFLAALISTEASLLSPIMNMMLEKFILSRRAGWEVPDFPAVSRETMRERLHTALRYLLNLFPAVTPVLQRLIASKFPYADDSKRSHVAYVHNLVKLKAYATDLDVDITNLLIDRLVNIDVQMQVDLDDLDDEVAASVTYSLGNTPEDDSWEGDEEASDDESDDDESIASDDTDFDEKEEKIRVVKNRVEKLDAILDTLFEVYTPHFDDPESEEAKDHFRVLLNSFTGIILPTSKSRHTQFLMFHFGQLSAGLRDLFVGTCIGVAMESNRPTFMRQAAVTYLAGFIARGVHVPTDIVQTVFRVLLRRTEIWRQKHELTARGPDLKRYQMYYAHMQAVLYIFCFRWRDLVVSAPEFVDQDDPASYLGHELVWLDGLYKGLRENIYSKLNPLKVCAPAIVEEFATLAHKLNLMYIFPLLETNKRIRLSQFVSNSYETGGALRDAGFDSLGEDHFQLDPYFPFDPYQLPVSKRWLEGDYVQWEAVPGLNMAVEDEDSDEADMEQDDEMDEEDTATDSENGDDD